MQKGGKSVLAQKNNTPKKVNQSYKNAYKKGKLSRNARFVTKKVNKTLVTVTLCVLFSFIFAVVLGTILGNKAENSRNEAPAGGDSAIVTPPKADRVPPHENLHAYFADMTGADPEVSLSAQTETARGAGNSIFVNLRTQSGALIYSSEVAEELGYEQSANLKLSRLGNHFDYYDDFAVGYFLSDFSHTLSVEDQLETSKNEALLLIEASEIAIDQIIIGFSGNITRDNAIHYCSYLLDIKLACGDTPVGVALPLSFLSDANNAGSVASLLGIADFFVFDLETENTDEISALLSPLVYIIERYNGVATLSGGSTLDSVIKALDDKGIGSYIVK